MSRSPAFVHTVRRSPAKTAASERVASFDEILADLSPARAAEQAARCSDCGVPFCQSACPLSNNVPDWLRLTAEGRLREAWDQAAATSAMPEICGRICPQDRLCEGLCVLEQSGWEAVTIGSVERHLGEQAWANGWVAPIRPVRERAGSVGIVGAGPAGLAAADRLRSAGWAVTVYDRHDRAGGLLIYGIPGFKLEKDVVERRTRRLAEGGVEFVLGCEIGRDVSLQDLRARHDAVLLAVGVYKARELAGPGFGPEATVPALDYLTASNRVGLGDVVPAFADGRLDAQGRRVVVIGGGDTAMDCVRTAVRQGAAQVTCLYRRDRENMPGSRREVEHAEEEGVRFEWLGAPKALLGEAGQVTGVRCVRMRLTAPDADGRRGVEETPGADFDLAADLVIEALGFEPEDLPQGWSVSELAVRAGGQVRVDQKTFMTSLDGVFAAGDVVRGASLVAWAVRDGQDAAAAVHAWLETSVQERAA